MYLINGKIYAIPGTDALLNESAGSYHLYLNPDNHTIGANPIPNWSLNSGSITYYVNLLADTSLTDYNFGFIPTDTLADLVSYVSSDLTICNQLVPYYFTWQNTGMTTLQASVIITLDNWIDSVEFTNELPYNILNSQQFEWVFDDLHP
jgi:hypothetical protein